MVRLTGTTELWLATDVQYKGFVSHEAKIEGKTAARFQQRLGNEYHSYSH
jgi:hypothetical protein